MNTIGLKGPRKKRYNLNDIKDDKKRQIAFIISGYITRSGLTTEQFANIPPRVSVSYLHTLFGSQHDNFPNPLNLKRLADKISVIFDDVNAQELYNKLLLIGGYDTTLYSYNRYNSIMKPNNVGSTTMLLSMDEYNRLTDELLRANTVLKQLFQLAKKQNDNLVWNNKDIANILKLAYPHEYNRLMRG